MSIGLRTQDNLIEPNTVFSNLQGGDGKCGICRDIHKFLAEAATAIGLEDVGMHFAIRREAGHGVRPRRRDRSRGHAPAHGGCRARGLASRDAGAWNRWSRVRAGAGAGTETAP